MRQILLTLAALCWAGVARAEGEPAGDFDYYVMSLSWSAAWCALEEPGVFVMNVMDDDKELDRHLQRLEHAFGGAVIAFQSLRDPNIVVIGLKGAPLQIEWRALRARAVGLERKYGLPFHRMVERLRTMNRWTADALFVVPPVTED